MKRGDLWKLEEIKEGSAERARLPIEFLKDVELELEAVIGRGRCTIRELLSLEKEDVIPLDRSTGEPVDIYLKGRLFAKGEIMVIDDYFGIRIIEIVDPDDI